MPFVVFSQPQSTVGGHADQGDGGAAAAAQGGDREDLDGRDTDTAVPSSSSQKKAATLKCRQCTATFSSRTMEGWTFSFLITIYYMNFFPFHAFIHSLFAIRLLK